MNRWIWPSFEQVPSGKIATEAPRDNHSPPSRSSCSNASAARPLSMQMSPWTSRNCPKKGDAEDFALGNPAEIERHVVERADVDHGLVVEYDDVTLAAVDVLQPLHPTGKGSRKLNARYRDIS